MSRQAESLAITGNGAAQLSNEQKIGGILGAGSL